MIQFSVKSAPNGQEVIDKAIEAGFSQLTLSTIDSWFNSLFANGCDLLQAFFRINAEQHPEVEIACRIADIQVVIGVAKIPASEFNTARHQITVTRFAGDKTYIMKMYSTEALVHFLILARDSGILSLFPQSQVAFARNEY